MGNKAKAYGVRRATLCLVLGMLMMACAPAHAQAQAIQVAPPLIVEPADSLAPPAAPERQAESVFFDDAATVTPPPVYRITFFDVFGNVYAWADVPEGGTIVEPSKPVIPGYDFHYWYDVHNVLHEPYDFDKPIASNVELWPLLTEVPWGSSASAGGDAVAADISQSILSTPPGGAETTAPPDAGILPEEFVDVVTEILATPPAEIETAAPTPQTTREQDNSERIMAQLMEGSFPSPEETEQPMDPRAIIAAIVPEDTGGLGDGATAVPTEQPQETKQPLDQTTVSLIEAILNNPAAGTISTRIPEAETATPAVETTEATEPPDSGAQAIETAMVAEAVYTKMPMDTTATPETSEAAATPTPAETMEPEATEPPDSGAQAMETAMVAEAVYTEMPVDTAAIPETSEAAATPTPAATMEPETTAAPLETPSPQVTSDIFGQTGAVGEDAATAPETAPTTGIKATVTIHTLSDDEVIGVGSTVTLVSTVEGVPAGALLTYQWQNDANGAFEDVYGATGDTYAYVVDESTIHCDWRLLVQVIIR